MPTHILTELEEQAKEIENQQQDKNKYSEEELKSAFRIGFSIGYGSSVQELDLKNEYCEKWFEKFKKK
jgi:predicted phage-related endonuclease